MGVKLGPRRDSPISADVAEYPIPICVLIFRLEIGMLEYCVIKSVSNRIRHLILPPINVKCI